MRLCGHIRTDPVEQVCVSAPLQELYASLGLVALLPSMHFPSLPSTHQWCNFQQCILLTEDIRFAIVNSYLLEGSGALNCSDPARSGGLHPHFSAVAYWHGTHWVSTQ